MSGNPRRHAIRPGGQPGVRLRLRLPSADPRHHRRARVDGLSVEGRKGTTMKRFGIAAAALMLVLAVVPTVDAATTWTARFSGRGLATVRVGSPTRLTLGLTGFRAGTTWTVSLRHGSCASVGTLVRSVRVKASSTGRLGGTVTLTARRRAAKLPPTAVRDRCASFTAERPPLPRRRPSDAELVAQPKQSPTLLPCSTSESARRRSLLRGVLLTVVAGSVGGSRSPAFAGRVPVVVAMKLELDPQRGAPSWTFYVTGPSGLRATRSRVACSQPSSCPRRTSATPCRHWLP